MKSKHTISTILFFTSFFLAPAGNAGHDAGNGGHSVACTGLHGELTSLQFFDLWYAKKELQLEQVSSGKDAKQLAREIVLRLFQADRAYFENLLVSYADVSHAQVRLGDELELIPPQAFLGNIIPTVDSACRIKPLAVYADSGVLLTARKLWTFLQSSDNPVPSNLHVAAFYVHESLGDMLRKRELAKLGAGAVLTEEIRKRIARDTVNMTALAFSPLTDRQLLRRLQHYWESGEVFQKPKLERIETKYQFIGTPQAGTDEAETEAETLCKDWRNAQLARLEPRSEFMIIECKEIGAYTVTNPEAPGIPSKDLWVGYAKAVVTAVPQTPVMKFTEDVRTSLFGYAEDPKLGDVQAAFWPAGKAWRLRMERRFGEDLYMAHPGAFARNESVGRRGVGSYAHDTGEVYRFVRTTDLRSQSSDISGGQYPFYGPAGGGARMAMQSFEETCQAWLDARYREGAVFATCSPEGIQYRTNEVQSTGWFDSRGVAYYYDE